MAGQRKIKLLLDLAMTVSMPVLMAYELISSVLHEWLGMAVSLLFILHHALNFGWHKTLGKGKYNAIRLTNLIVNGLLAFIMLLLPISGLIMSEHILPFIDAGAGTAAARILHLLASYWGYTLMSLHIGLHWDMIRNTMKKRRKSIPAPIWKRALPHILTAAVMLYGGYAFAVRQLGSYMFLQSQFVFFDFSEPLLFFFADYIAILGLFACAGYYLSRILKSTGKTKTLNKGGEA